MDVLIDMIDPGYRNEMMVLSVGRAFLGELDLVGPVQVIDLSDGLPVGGYDVHVLFDLRRIGHCASPWDCCRTKRRRPGNVPRTLRSAISAFTRVFDALWPVRCRAGVVTNTGVWYGPGSAKRHEECRIASGTRAVQPKAYAAIGCPARGFPCHRMRLRVEYRTDRLVRMLQALHRQRAGAVKGIQPGEYE
jgi:hypothetical protein